ncbi:PRC-barrel domain-containing protein [Actinoplanes sp. NPDC048967]|uniref:PRC-barrel domain-containing protein n=1 Tax=Actinoplanes sp. NPDC048967 TaxID=3155269 RepID=UPI0034079A83
MASQSTTPLVKLSDSSKILSDPAQDLRGRTVCDRTGDELGKIDDLLIDEAEREVRFLQIGHGGILGFGVTTSLIPATAVTGMTDDTVYVGASRDQVAGAPGYEPTLVDGTETFDKLYGYYGYLPR